MDRFFEEMFLTSTILESTFDHFKIPKDTNLKGNIIERTNEMSLEIQLCVKIVSSKLQILNRRKLVNSKCLEEYSGRQKLYESEEKDYSANIQCEEKLLQFIIKANTDIQLPHDNLSFKSVIFILPFLYYSKMLVQY